MAILPHQQILSLYAAVVSSNLAGTRAALLGGIDAALAGGLPICTSQSSQILSDLHGLNAVEQLDTGAVPLTLWLGNALALAGPLPEADVFRSALRAAEGGERFARRSVRGETDDVADELARIARASLLASDHELRRSLYEVEALLERAPRHIEARMLRDRLQQAVEEAAKLRHLGARMIFGQTDAGGVVPAGVAPSAAQPWLRRPPGGFIGRARELVELTSRTGRAGVLVCGLRGMGKTALALTLAHALAPQYPDLQISIDLQGTSGEPLSPAAAMAHVLRAFLPALRWSPEALADLGVPGPVSRRAVPELPESLEELTGLYRRVLAGQRALILLEDAGDASQVEPLLPPAGSMVVVTSRRRFTLPDVHVLSLDRLEAADAQALLQSLAPGMEGDAGKRLAELCGGVPVALRLAGGALANRLDLTPEAYIERLEVAQSRYDLLDASLSVGVALLDPVLQILWSRLGLVFASRFSAYDAMVRNTTLLTTDHDLSDLAAPGLLDHDPGTELYRVPRWGRRFAMSRLTDADRAASAQASAELGASRWDHDVGNLGDATSRRRILAHALRAARRSGHRPAEATYLEELAGDIDTVPLVRRAAAIEEGALAIYREVGDRHGESRVLGKLVARHQRMNDERRAVDVGEQALVILRELGDRRKESSLVRVVCALHERLKNERRAIELWERDLAIHCELGLRPGQGEALEAMARLHERLSEDRRAVELQQQCFALARERGARSDQARLAGQLGASYQRLGALNEAIAALELCADLNRALGRFHVASSAEDEIERLRALETR